MKRLIIATILFLLLWGGMSLKIFTLASRDPYAILRQNSEYFPGNPMIVPTAWFLDHYPAWTIYTRVRIFPGSVCLPEPKVHYLENIDGVYYYNYAYTDPITGAIVAAIVVVGVLCVSMLISKIGDKR